MHKYYVNHVSYSRKTNGEKLHIQCDEEQIVAGLWEQIFDWIKDGSLYRLEIGNKDTDLSLSLFVERNHFFVGTVDMYNDEEFYYTNGTDDRTLVEIAGGYYESRLVGQDLNLLCDIIEQFALDGTRSEEAQWIEEVG